MRDVGQSAASLADVGQLIHTSRGQPRPEKATKGGGTSGAGGQNHVFPTGRHLSKTSIAAEKQRLGMKRVLEKLAGQLSARAGLGASSGR